jgi:hypothetical protein
MVKIYTMFHLHKQKWDAHRQDGKADGEAGAGGGLSAVIPKMQMAMSVLMLVMFVTTMVGVK